MCVSRRQLASMPSGMVSEATTKRRISLASLDEQARKLVGPGPVDTDAVGKWWWITTAVFNFGSDKCLDVLCSPRPPLCGKRERPRREGPLHTSNRIVTACIAISITFSQNPVAREFVLVVFRAM